LQRKVRISVPGLLLLLKTDRALIIISTGILIAPSMLSKYFRISDV
jgi:hypothetical protein